MPPIEEADFIDVAIVWVRTGFNRNNEPVLAAPVETPCRWVHSNRMSTNAEGIPIELTARVAMPITVPTRSVLWLGELKDWADSGTQDLHEVVSIDRARDLKGHNERREYNLSRFRGKLPIGTPER